MSLLGTSESNLPFFVLSEALTKDRDPRNHTNRHEITLVSFCVNSWIVPLAASASRALETLRFQITTLPGK